MKSLTESILVNESVIKWRLNGNPEGDVRAGRATTPYPIDDDADLVVIDTEGAIITILEADLLERHLHDIMKKEDVNKFMDKLHNLRYGESCVKDGYIYVKI